MPDGVVRAEGVGGGWRVAPSTTGPDDGPAAWLLT